MIKKTLISISCLIVLLSGCVQTETIEDIQIIESIGYDSADDKKYELTLATVMFSPSEGGIIKSETVSDANFTGYGAAWNAQRETPKPTAAGKMMVALFGKDLAENGVDEILDGLKRHSTIGRMVDFCVIEGEAKELLEGEYPLGQTVSRYLKELLEHHKKGNLPSTNFHEFMYKYYSKGQDPFMPLIQKEEDKIKLKGLALFKDDQYVDSIPADKLLIFKMLYEDINIGTYQASLENPDGYAAIEAVESTVKYRIKKGMTKPEIQISVNIKANINEVVSSIKLENASDEKNLENSLEKDLTENGLQMIKHFQKEGIDPLGIGDRVRSKTRGWESTKWQELYPHASVGLNVSLDILETGITE
ncbi:Ger(x)C family spore germination protein [Cytobacillus firmus]|uniref:Ger(x)C family spore germination protein n=1 Tax=Cytobacillus firmus TaxID=1399 RepID=UPI001C8EC317|nr:Ger(x)C family spore germination protein [Cytobacillus firmus]MBX9975755.1 Ger(x)C family spore germination protein [Cytobacillus firmus]